MDGIGKKIRELRERHGWTLQEFGRRTGFSASFLSQLERGQCSISITSLDRIAKALGVQMGYFFPRDASNGRIITRRDERQAMSVEGSLLSYEWLAGDFAGRSLDAFLVRMKPGEIQDGTYRHDGEEFGYVLEGRLTVWVDGREEELGPGDVLHFPSTLPHAWENRSDQDVVSIWITTQRFT